MLEIVESSQEKPTRLTQSVAIVEYLDEVHPNYKLLPEDKLQRARARQIAEIVNSGIQPLQSLSLLRQVKSVELIGTAGNNLGPRDFAVDAIVRGFVAIEALLEENMGGADSTLFAAGTTRPSIADVFLVPQVYNAGRFGVSMANYPRIASVVERCNQLTAFQKAAPEAQPDAVL